VRTYSLYFQQDISLAVAGSSLFIRFISTTQTIETSADPVTQAGAFETDLITFLQNCGDNPQGSVDVTGNILTVSASVEHADGDTEAPLAIVVFYDPNDGNVQVAKAFTFISSEDPIECPECYEQTLSACQDEYDITTGLTPLTEYVVVLTDHFNKEYYQTVTSDAAGDLTISMTEMPEGFSTPDYGPSTLEVKLSVDDEPLDLAVAGESYPCIQLNYVYRSEVTPDP
jgi:hypothetical protein